MKTKYIMNPPIFLALLFITYVISCSASSAPIEFNSQAKISFSQIQTKAEVKVPLIFVTKRPSKETVRINEWFDVYIIVSNVGNDTAHDLYIIDERYPAWTFETRNHTGEYYLPRLDPNITIFIKYSLRVRNSYQKNISLGRVTIKYKDASNNEYEVLSEEIYIHVELRMASIDTVKLDKIILISTTVIICSSLLCLIYIERKTLVEFLATKRRS